jgi:hypothetical protein
MLALKPMIRYILNGFKTAWLVRLLTFVGLPS